MRSIYLHDKATSSQWVKLVASPSIQSRINFSFASGVFMPSTPALLYDSFTGSACEPTPDFLAFKFYVIPSFGWILIYSKLGFFSFFFLLLRFNGMFLNFQ